VDRYYIHEHTSNVNPTHLQTVLTMTSSASYQNSILYLTMCLKTSLAFQQHSQSHLYLPHSGFSPLMTWQTSNPNMTYKKNKSVQKLETYNKLPPILIWNNALLQQRYFEHTSPDTCNWVTLKESKFNNWKLNHFHGTGTKDLTTPTPTTAPFPISNLCVRTLV
jgi:hypothetical protein